MPFSGIIGLRKTENGLEWNPSVFPVRRMLKQRNPPSLPVESGGGFLKPARSRSSRQVFFFLVQEKPVLVRITSEGPSKENRLEEII